MVGTGSVADVTVVTAEITKGEKDAYYSYSPGATARSAGIIGDL